MKPQRTTLILILSALGLGGFVYFYEIRGATQRQEIQAQKQQIFSFTEEQVQSLTIKKNEQTLTFERANQPSKTKWQMKAPENTPASDASVSYLMDLLVKGKSDRTLSVPVSQLPEYGLNQPQAAIEIKLNNQETHQLILGKPDFNRSFLYAQTSSAKAADNVNVFLVSTDFENAINRQLTEWKSAK